MLSPFLDFVTLDGYNALYLACHYDSIGIALELMKSRIFQRKLEQVDRGKLQDIFPSSEKRSVFMLHLYWPQVRQILGLSSADGPFWLPLEVVGHLIYLFCASRVSSVKAIEDKKKGKKVERPVPTEKDKARDKTGKDKEKDRDKTKTQSRASPKYEHRSEPHELRLHQDVQQVRQKREKEKEKKKLRNIFPLRSRKNNEANLSL